ncbi:hypothetical protein [Methanogenium cariaci]|nr:hypothetical protein [Methanogenium cariaci]
MSVRYGVQRWALLAIPGIVMAQVGVRVGHNPPRKTAENLSLLW